MPYWIVCSCMIGATLYAIFLMPETLPRANRDKSVRFFDKEHFNAVIDVVRKKPARNGNLRWLIALNYFLHVSYFGSYIVTILFLLDRPLCWSPLAIGLYSAERFFCLGIGAVIGVKFLSKCLKTMHIIYFGLLTYITSLILFAFADTTALVCSGKVLILCLRNFRFLMGKLVAHGQWGLKTAPQEMYSEISDLVRRQGPPFVQIQEIHLRVYHATLFHYSSRGGYVHRGGGCLL